MSTSATKQWVELPVGVSFMPKANVTKITIGRLYNLGSYEHVRYEISAEVPPGGSASETILGIERVLAGLRPKCPVDYTELNEKRRRAGWEEEDWKRSWFADQKGGWEQARCDNAVDLEKMEAQLKQWQEHQDKTRKLLDDLGAASQYKDAKLDWEDDDL